MTGVLFGCCFLAARFIAWPYLCGFMSAAWPDVLHLARRARFLWRTRRGRWKAWRNPGSTEPWTREESDKLAAAFMELCFCEVCNRSRRDCRCGR
jgi:hypothetical protein